MIFDSKEQKDLLIHTMRTVPMQTDLGSLLDGKLQVGAEMGDLLNAISEGTIAEVVVPEKKEEND